jgi:hypothetical protein
MDVLRMALQVACPALPGAPCITSNHVMGVTESRAGWAFIQTRAAEFLRNTWMMRVLSTTPMVIGDHSNRCPGAIRPVAAALSPTQRDH